MISMNPNLNHLCAKRGCATSATHIIGGIWACDGHKEWVIQQVEGRLAIKSHIAREIVIHPTHHESYRAWKAKREASAARTRSVMDMVADGLLWVATVGAVVLVIGYFSWLAWFWLR